MKPTGKSVAAFAIKYAAALLFIFIVSGFTSTDPALSFLIELIRISLYPVIISAIARAVGLFGYRKVEKTVKFSIANGIYLYLFTGIFEYNLFYFYHSVSYLYEFFGIFLFFYSINLSIFAGSMKSKNISPVGGRSIGILAYSAFFAALGLLTASLPLSYLPVFQYPFEFTAVALLPFTAGPFLLASEKLETASAGKYMHDSMGKWATMGFMLGVMISILYIPKPSALNAYIFIFFLIVIVLVFLYIMIKVYSSSSRRMDSITANVFGKFKHSVNIYGDQRFQDIVGSVDQFIRDGKKDSLLIQLTILLNSMEMDYQKINHILAPILNYEVPFGIRYGILNLREEIEVEIAKRKSIVEQTVRNISVNSSGVAYG
ncbi:MAG: hypothetical protein ACP5NK_05860 [Thermoplasmata archaeon]